MKEGRGEGKKKGRKERRKGQKVLVLVFPLHRRAVSLVQHCVIICSSWNPCASAHRLHVVLLNEYMLSVLWGDRHFVD